MKVLRLRPTPPPDPFQKLADEITAGTPPPAKIEKELYGLLRDSLDTADRSKQLTAASPVASTDAPPEGPAYPRQCTECGERFRDESAFYDHLRSDEERNPPSVKFLRGAPLLERCRSPKAMWSAGWIRVEPQRKGIPRQKRANGVWQQPVVKLRPHVKVPPESSYRCVLCRKVFKEVQGFQAHHVHTHSNRERCLDTSELRALLFEQSAAGVWRIAIGTQWLPSQVARLASVRVEAAALAKEDHAANDSAEKTTAIRAELGEIAACRKSVLS
jgi:hypothetical protein